MTQSSKQGAAPKVGFVSLGCPKALVDSEHILTRLRAEGYEISPSYEGSDLVVIGGRDCPVSGSPVAAIGTTATTVAASFAFAPQPIGGSASHTSAMRARMRLSLQPAAPSPKPLSSRRAQSTDCGAAISGRRNRSTPR